LQQPYQPNGQYQQLQPQYQPQDIDRMVDQRVERGLASHRATSHLEAWQRDKPHFEAVRYDMGTLMTPDESGRASVDISQYPDMQAALDDAYERACYMNPEIRGKMLAQDQEKQRKAQHLKTARVARQMNIGANSTPGNYDARQNRDRGGAKGESVRDTLKRSIAELAS